MDRKGEFVSKTIELAAGVIAAYVAYRVSAPISNFAGLFSVIIGLLTTLVVAHLVESYRHSQDIRNTNLQLASLLRRIGEEHQESSDWVQVLRHGNATFPREQYFDIFLQLLWRMENGVLAANYVSPGEGWRRAYGELYNEIQHTKVKVNKADIRRVFVVDDEKEVQVLRAVMSEQKETGVKVRYIFKRKIDGTSMLKSAADKLETLDFDVVDSKYVWLALLDKNRRIKYGKLVFAREECDRYKRFYHHLFEEAEEFEA
jgi:hypothetical protein